MSINDMLHPRIYSTVTDNSTVTTEEVINSGKTLFQIIFAEKGKANEIKTIKSLLAFDREFGKLNYKKYGRAAYNVRNFIKNGGIANVMRVVPVTNSEYPDIQPASIANFFLDVQTKHVDAVTENESTVIGIDKLVLTTDTVNIGQTIVTPKSGSLTVSKVKPGSKVLFTDYVTNHLVNPLSVSKIKTYFVVEGTNLGIQDLAVGDAVRITYSDGSKLDGVVSSDNTSITRYGFLLENNDVDLSSESIVTIEKLNEGSVEFTLGSAYIKKVGKITSDAALGIKGDIFLSLFGFNSLNGKTLILSGINNGTSFSHTITYGEAVADSSSFISFTEGVTNDGGLDDNQKLRVRLVNGLLFIYATSTITTGTSTISVSGTAAGDLLSSTVSKRSASVSNELSVSNVSYQSELVLSSVDNADVTLNVYTKKPISKDYIFVTCSDNELLVDDDDTISSVDKFGEVLTPKRTISTKVYTFVTNVVRTKDDGTQYIVDASLGFNIISFNSNPTSIHNSGALLVLEEAKDAHVLVRNVIVSKHIESETEADEFLANPEADPNFKTTPDGFTRHIMFGFTKDQSMSSNNYGIVFNTNNTNDEVIEGGYRLYNLSIVEFVNNTVKLIDGPFVFSFDPNAIDVNSNQYYLEKVYRNSKKLFTLHTHGDASEEKYEELLDDVSADTSDAINPGNIDFLFKTEREVANIPVEQSGIELSDASISFKSYGGTTSFPYYNEANLLVKTITYFEDGFTEVYQNYGKFALGSSGSLDGLKIDGSKLSSTEMEELKTNLLIDGYKGSINEEVFNSNKYPASFLFDALHPITVKKAMVEFASDELRNNIVLFLDLGLNATSFINTLNIKQNSFSDIGGLTSSFRIFIFPQTGKVYDEFTLTEIRQAIPYVFTRKILENIKNNGIHKAIVFKNRGIIDDFIKETFSFSPSINQQEVLYKNKINYALEDENNVITLNTQMSAQNKTSSLSYLNNVMILMEIREKLEAMASYVQGDSQTEVINQVTTKGNKILESYVGKGLKSASIKASVTQADLATGIKRVSAVTSLVFVDTNETIVFNFEINL